MEERRYSEGKSIGEIIRERNIVLRGADPITQRGFTQVPNFLLNLKSLSASAKLAYAMLLSYAWQNDFCFPGQERLATDLGITDRSVRSHLKELEKHALLRIVRRGQGKTNVYELNLLLKGLRPDRKKSSDPDRKKIAHQERKQVSDPSIEEYPEELYSVQEDPVFRPDYKVGSKAISRQTRHNALGEAMVTKPHPT